MAPSTAHDRRSSDGIVLFLYAVLAALGLYTMRIVTTMNDVPVGFMEMLQAPTLPDGTLIKTVYTGIEPLDQGLTAMVSAFMLGSTGWNQAFYWQPEMSTIKLIKPS
ncbi:hypothetical protein ACJQWK_09422 [Exserohilum turcicum]